MSRNVPLRRGRSAGERSLFVASGAWIAYFGLRDDRHREADALLRAAVAARPRLLTTSLVLAEVHRWLLFRAGIGPAAATLDRIDANCRAALTFDRDFTVAGFTPWRPEGGGA